MTQIEEDLERIARQERELQWTTFNESDAWELGCTLRELAVERQLAIVIDIRRFAATLGNQAGAPVFYAALPGTSPANAEWARRKANVVARFHRSSYVIGLGLKQNNQTLQQRQALSDSDYATHGGAFPIAVAGAGVIGSITVSGLDQRDDHELVVEALCLERNRHYADLRLPPID